MKTEDCKKHTRWSTWNNGKIVPFPDCDLPTEFVLEHFEGAAIVGGDLLLPICYDMLAIVDHWRNYSRGLSQEFEISECITYKHLAIPMDFILENFPNAEVYYDEDGKKVLNLPNSHIVKDIVAAYKTYLVSSMVESL